MDDERSSSTAVRLAPGRAAVPGPWRRVRFDRVGLAVKYIDERLEEVAEIVFKPDAGEHRRSRLDGGLELPALPRVRRAAPNRARPGRGGAGRAAARRGDAQSAMRRGTPRCQCRIFGGRPLMIFVFY